MTQKVLIVDDEDLIREEIFEFLTHKGYECVSVCGAGPALEAINGDLEISIVLTDLKMPGRDGLELISTAKSEVERELEFILMTGHGEKEVAIEALRLETQDFIEKPIKLKQLLQAIKRCEKKLRLKHADYLSRKSLEAEVQTKNVEMRSLYDDIETAYEYALTMLAIASSYKDPDTGAHIKRIAAYSRVLAQACGFSGARLRIIELAAPLHDVGKIGVPDTVLQKPGKLDRHEIMLMKKHSEIGHSILSGSNEPVLRCAANIAWSHHERWDGTGYPRGLKGEEIPFEASIVSIVDVYDALRVERTYKPALSHEEVIRIMINGDGRTLPGHFHPEIHHMFCLKADDFDVIYKGGKDDVVK